MRVACTLATIAILADLVLTLGGCGGGGGSNSAAHGRLLSIEFPNPSDVNPEPTDAPPSEAPLLQQIVFTFNRPPDPDSIGQHSIPIRDLNGFPVPGAFTVAGATVTFTPRLPTQPIVISGDGSIDVGGAGLLPGSSYTLRLGPQMLAFISDVDPGLLSRYGDPIYAGAVIMLFKTGTDPAHFFAGPPVVAPHMDSVDPADGAIGVSPNLYRDPERRFALRRSFQIRFDAPVNPDVTNVGSDTFRLVDLDDPATQSIGGLPLGIDVRVLENELDHAVIEITPSGILPFGHQISLEYLSDLRGISQSGSPAGAPSVASVFTIANATSDPVRDMFVEDFDTSSREATDGETGSVGVVPADWNVRDSGILQAAFAFRGDGLLGRFVPSAPIGGETHVVVLDTAQQSFPLLDGSTPDAPVITIQGGVFSFTEIDVPSGVAITPLGDQPLVLSATGSVRLAGAIFVGAQDGSSDNAFDSAVTSVPGGAAVAGGGRGGEGHPILFFPPDVVSLSNLVSPPYGGQGFGMHPADGLMQRIGGTGGQCGMVDHPDAHDAYSTNHELDCFEGRQRNPGVKVPGGGGGSMFWRGYSPGDADSGFSGDPKTGTGNVLPDGQGRYVVRNIKDDILDCGAPGRWPFFDDGDVTNDFYGTRGQLRRLIGGQGGGSGASSVEAYYCGIWCWHDDDPNDDRVCNGEDFGPSGNYGDSVGDARGGGGGGGGGALLIQALGPVTLEPTALLDAHGGKGGGGEAIGCSNFGGGGGGGAGGMVIVQSATSIFVDAGARIDVREGAGNKADDWDVYERSCANDGGDDGAIGDGGAGGQGFVQLQVPFGAIATVVDPDGTFLRHAPRFDPRPWIDWENVLNPVEFTPVSVAVSSWFDLGRTITRTPGATPAFSFSGIDANGFVQTDSNGFQLDPAAADITCEYLGEYDPVHRTYKQGHEPKADYVPPNASVKVEFQGANAIVDGSKEPDPPSLTPWSPLTTIADGMQFIRWRVTFDLTANTSEPLTPGVPRPAVQLIQIHASF